MSGIADYVESALDEALPDDAGDSGAGAGETSSSEGESGTTEEGSGDSAAPTAPATALPSAAQASASGVTREEFAAMQREFLAENKRIREEFARSGPQPKKDPEAPVVDPESEAFHAKYLRTPAGWASYVKELQQDPSMYERSITAVVNRARAGDFAAIKKLQEEFKSYREATDKELAEARGHRVIADHRYAESPRWQKYGKDVLASFEEGLFNASHKDAIEKAFKYHETLAKAKGATNAQAAAAGQQAAQATAGKIAAKATKPGPHDEPSLREGKRAATAHTTQTRTSAGKGKDWLDSIAGDAAEKAMRTK